MLKTDATRNPQRGDIYPYRGAPEHVGAQASFPGSRVRRSSDRIPSAHTQSQRGGVTTWFITAISTF
jgi:hypothetical protein